MKWSCPLTLFAAILVTATFLHAQQPNTEHGSTIQPTFKEHRIGESAQEFFAIAKMADKDGMRSTDYCRSYLNDPKVNKAIERSKKKGLNDPSVVAATMDVEGCNRIQTALAGQDVEISARFAVEFGSGSAQFIAGHLASVSFVVKAPFRDVVEDMTAKLNAKPQLGIDTFQNTVGAIVKQQRAVWTLPNTLVKVSELQSLEGDNLGTEVSLFDPALMKHRTNSLN
jgi:hypothetical protein